MEDEIRDRHVLVYTLYGTACGLLGVWASEVGKWEEGGGKRMAWNIGRNIY